MNDERTLYQLAQEAWNVQDACNLSGVVHSFSRSMTRLRTLLEAEPGFSTTVLNQHPICVLFSDKIAHLTGTQFIHDRVEHAYKEIKNILGR